MVLMEAVSRFVPGVLGDEESAKKAIGTIIQEKGRASTLY